MSDDNREPLIHAMSKASGALLDQTFGEATHRQCWAAEIRALADIIEQRGEQGHDLDPGETADWLRAEAERAELEPPQDCR